MTTVANDSLLSDPRTVLFPLTVDQYHRMIAEGILPEGEPFELLDGKVIRKDRSANGDKLMTVGLAHSLVVKKLAALSRKLEAMGCHLQTQQPVALPPNNEPEPDGAIVAGTVEDYAEHHPGPADVLCVIEVADASLKRDRIAKLRIYASAGIGMYIILNLPDRVAEVHSGPVKGQYSAKNVVGETDVLQLPTPNGKGVAVSLRKLLP